MTQKSSYCACGCWKRTKRLERHPHVGVEMFVRKGHMGRVLDRRVKFVPWDGCMPTSAGGPVQMCDGVAYYAERPDSMRCGVVVKPIVDKHPSVVGIELFPW